MTIDTRIVERDAPQATVDALCHALRSGREKIAAANDSAAPGKPSKGEARHES